MRIEFASKKKAKPAKAKSSHTKVSKKKPSITSGGHSHTATKKKATKNVGGSHTKPVKKKAPSSKIKKPAPSKIQITPPSQRQDIQVVAPAVATAHFTSMDELLTFMTGIDGTGRVNAAVDDAVEHGFAPQDYHPASYPATINLHKFGTTQVGTSGTAYYSFDAASGWSEAEKSTFRMSMALWSNVANVAFVETANQPSNGIVFKRGTDGRAVTYSTSTRAYAGGTSINNAIGNITISMDTNVWGAIDFANNYTFQALTHEIGHAIGLHHSGEYNGSVDAASQQNGPYDNRQWTIMSYINPSDTRAKYYGSSAMPGTRWQSTASTPMVLDVAAAQRIYGKPVSGATQGGQTFGFNSNVAGPAHNAFDFNVNRTPVVTIYDAGANNTLDLSGWNAGAMISLVPGTFTSASADGRATNNIGIAFDTKIDHVVGTRGNDTIVINPDLATTMTGAGGNDIFEASARGFNNAMFTDLNWGDTIHFTDANMATFGFADYGNSLVFGDERGFYNMAFGNDPLGTFIKTADARGGVDLTLVASSAFA